MSIVIYINKVLRGLLSRGLAIALPVCLVLPGCETELDVRAPHKNIPVIYGLLDQQDAYHFIKINRVYNGQADALELAKIRDSSEYQNVDAYVQEIHFGEVTKTYQLKDTLITGKEAGDFYYPNQTVYYFHEPNLRSAEGYSYKITVNLSEENTATATTTIITAKDIFPRMGQRFTNSGVQFVTAAQFNPLTVNFVPPPRTRNAQLDMYFTYCNVYNDGSSNQDTIQFPLGNKLIQDTENPSEVEYSFAEERFYQVIEQRVPDKADTPDLNYRMASWIFFEVQYADEDLQTYMEIHGPGNTVFQEKPPFTNIENGVGIFCSRSVLNSIESTSGDVGTGYDLSLFSERELATGDMGQYTQAKGFVYNDANRPDQPVYTNYCLP